MNYLKSFLSVIVCTTLIGSGTIRPIKKKKPKKTQHVQPCNTGQSVIKDTKAPSKWFIVGQTYAKQMITLAGDPNVTVIDLAKTVYSKPPDDFAHKQEYYKGMKQGLSTFTPIQENDITTNQKSRLIQYFQIAADCWLEAKDFNEVRKIFSVKIKEFQEHVLSTMSPAKLGYEYGYCHGNRLGNVNGWECHKCLFIMYEDTIRNAYETHDESFLTAIEKFSQEAQKEVTAYYFLGIKESLRSSKIRLKTIFDELRRSTGLRQLLKKQGRY